MAKMYTLDHKLLTEAPEIRIGEKIYAVDNRQKTVKKILAATKEVHQDNPYTGIDLVMELALGEKAAAEIDEMDLPYPGYLDLFEMLMAAVTGEEPEVVVERLHEGKGT